MDWFRKAFAATIGFMSAQVAWVIIVILLGSGCCLCLLLAMAKIGEQG